MIEIFLIHMILHDMTIKLLRLIKCSSLEHGTLQLQIKVSELVQPYLTRCLSKIRRTTDYLYNLQRSKNIY